MKYYRRWCGLVAVLLISAAPYVRSENICNQCKCDGTAEAELIVRCDGTENESLLQLDFKEIQWPSTTKNISAYFNNLELSIFPKLLSDPQVKLLNFDNNKIYAFVNEPLEYFKNLEVFSMASNSLKEIPNDLFRMTVNLRELNLSNNSLSDIDGISLSHAHLDTVDLSHNKLTKISTELQKLARNARTLKLDNNNIFAIESSDEPLLWMTLNLSHNKLTVLSSSTFHNQFSELTHLDLSMNALANVDRDAFENVNKLEQLDLSHNDIEDSVFRLPDSLRFVSLEGNRFKLWPIHRLPENLVQLDAQTNRMIEIIIEHEPLHLKILNLSSNNLLSLPSVTFPALETLDLSSNDFNAVPKELPKLFPNLDTLILDQNLISVLEFDGEIALKRLSLSDLPLLKSIDAGTFKNIVGKKDRKDESSKCVDLIISHCAQLATIHDEAFSGTNICHLDLSYNGLRKISEKLADWPTIEDGINLQGNPFHCNCDAQWMLDHILKQLYEQPEHQYLLSNLKCEGPDPFANQRFVKYYKRNGAFCNPSAAMRMSPDEEVVMAGILPQDSKTEGIRLSLNEGPGIVMIIVLCCAVLLALIAAGLYLVKQEKQRLARRNRRFEK